MTTAQFLKAKWDEIEAQEKDWINPPLEYWLRWQYDNTYVPYQKLFNLEPLTYGKWLLQPVPLT